MQKNNDLKLDKTKEPVKIDELIRAYQEKHNNIMKRMKFIEKLNELNNYKLEMDAQEGELEFTDLRITLQNGHKYNSNNVISISNSLIVQEFVNYIIGKVEIKIEELELEIIAA